MEDIGGSGTMEIFDVIKLAGILGTHPEPVSFRVGLSRWVCVPCKKDIHEVRSNRQLVDGK